METTKHLNIDQAIENYRAAHGDNPLYCIMSAQEADELTESLKKSTDDANVLITSYRDIKIIRDEFMERGDYFLSNELPETGS